MKDKKDIKEKMLELYSTESSIEREKVQDIIFLDNLKFKPYNAMAEFSQADLFIVKKQEPDEKENGKYIEIMELYIQNEQVHLKVGELINGKIIFTEEYLEYVASINALIADVVKKQNGHDLPVQEQTHEDAIQLDKDDLEHQYILKRLEKTEEKRAEPQTEQVQEKQAITKIAEKSGMSEGDLSSCSEISPTQKITNEKSFEDITNMKDKYIKVFVVNSDSNSRGTSRFAFWGLRKDGEVEQIPGLEERDGVNTGKEICAINRDGSEVTKKQTTALFSLEGKEEGFALTIGQYGILETDYVRRAPEQGDKPLSIPVETSTQIYPTTMQVRKFMNDKYMNKADLKKTTQTANHQLDSHGDKEAEVETTNLSQISKRIKDEAININEEVKLHNGRITTIAKEAARLEMSITEYTNRFEQLEGDCIADKIELIAQEKQMEHVRQEERAREERMTPEEEAEERRLREQMKKMM